MRYLVVRTPTTSGIYKGKHHLDVLENVTSIKDLRWRLKALDKDDMDIVAVPVVDVLIALGIVESDEIVTIKES